MCLDCIFRTGVLEFWEQASGMRLESRAVAVKDETNEVSPEGSGAFGNIAFKLKHSLQPTQRIPGDQGPRSGWLWVLGLVLSLTGGVMAAQTERGTGIDHPVDGSFVRDWLVLGPFPSREMETDFLADAGGETMARPNEGDRVTTSSGSQLTWTRHRSESDMVNLEDALGVQEFSVAYVYCELESERSMETDVRAYSYGQGVLWLNGKRVGSTANTLGVDAEIPPALPIQLNPGKNACLLKLQVQNGLWTFLFQPLPSERAVFDLKVFDLSGDPVPDALVQFYDGGELVGRMKTGDSGGARACLYPSAGVYDLRITSGGKGTWLSDVALEAGGRREIEAKLMNADSVSGRVLAIDRSPQCGIVVQAISTTDLSRSRKTDQRNEPGRRTRIKSLVPQPAYSETVLTDTNGNFRLLNLRPGKYQLRCHGADGFVSPTSIQGTNTLDSGEITVEPGRSLEGVEFVFPEVKKGVWKNYSIIEGLSEVQPTTLHRTSDGLLWVGTDQSFVYAFDGLEFKKVASSPEVQANEIVDLEGGSDGTIWIGTSAGVSRHFGGQTHGVALDETLSRKSVNNILVDPDGTVWFGTDSGLFTHDAGDSLSLSPVSGSPRDLVTSLLRARDGVLWMGTLRGLVRFDGERFTQVQPFAGFCDRGIKRLHQARDGAIWFAAAAGGGVFRYDGKAFARFGVEDGLLDDEVYDIAETSDGALWFATGWGLSKFNGTTVVNYQEKDGLSNRWVRDLLVDSDDVIWCANGWGVSRFDTRGFTGFTQRDGLRDRSGNTAGVFAIEPGAGGSFWIGTQWAGVFRTDGGRLQSMDGGGEESYVRQILQTANDTLWMGTDWGVLKREHGQTVRVLDRKWVIALCSDDAGNLWFGHGWNGGGVSRYNPKTGEETVFSEAEGLPDNHVWALAPGLDGGVWIGTGAGLARFREGGIEGFQEKLGIPAGPVFNLRRDEDDALWIGARNGLHRWKEGERISVTTTNGMPEDQVWCSARTSDGKIWIGTERHGLLGYDGRAMTVLDKRDGLEGNTVFSVRANADDSLWVGFLDGGLTRYRPSSVRPSVRIRSVRLEDQTLTDFAKIPSVQTGHRVTFQFEEVDQKTHPEKRQFWYRLLNQSGEIVFSSVVRDRRFEWTPQKRGTYSFEVQSIDRDLNYSEPARVKMRVTVPWHANAWILTPSVLAFGGLFVWAFVARALYQRKSREAAVLRERVRISRDLHDHLGAGLTHLAMVGDLVRRQAAQPGAVEMLANRLTASARELTRTMGEIIWATDPDKDTLRSFALFISGYAERYFADSTLRLRFEVPEKIPDVALPTEHRSALLTVTKEALNNVAKHANASELRITLEVSGQELHLGIEDDGEGFLMNQVAAECHGLINMRQRLRDLGGDLRIESAKGQGTKVHARLQFSKK